MYNEILINKKKYIECFKILKPIDVLQEKRYF